MFVPYLSHYFAEKAPRKSRDPRYTCLSYVNAALTQSSTSMLGRVFNEFPVKYVERIDEKEQVFYPVSPEISDKWLIKYDTAINAMTFTEKTGEIIISIDQEAEEQIQLWVKEMIAHACLELLDDDGKLKQEIIDTLQLQDILDAWKNTPRLADIEFQIIYSYCVQLLFGLVQLQWEKEMLNDFKGDLRLMGQLNCYIEKLFGDSNKKAWTQFFQEQITLFEKSKTLVNACIAKLKKISNNKLSDAIQAMTRESQTLIFEAGEQSPDIWMKQIGLWIDIMYHFKMQNDLLRVRLINEMLSNKVMDVLKYEFLHSSDEKNQIVERYQLSDEMLHKYTECEQFINPALKEMKQSVPEVNPGTLSNILNSCSRLIQFLKPRSIFYYAGLYQPAPCALEAKIEMDVLPVVQRSRVY